MIDLIVLIDLFEHFYIILLLQNIVYNIYNHHMDMMTF